MHSRTKAWTMSSALISSGKLAFIDSGTVPNSSDYTTIVIVHGFGFHSEGLTPVLPFAHENNARIVLLNRRDFPGSAPYTKDEIAQMDAADAAGNTDEGRAIWKTFMRERSRELAEFLQAFIIQEGIPKAHGDRGGITLVCWSMASLHLMRFGLDIEGFASGDLDLGHYIRKYVLYDTPCNVLGYPSPSDPYSPMFTDELKDEERAAAFVSWVSGYYSHHEAADGLERRKPAIDRPPTLLTLSDEQSGRIFDQKAGGPEGSEQRHLRIPNHVGIIAEDRDRFLFNIGRQGDHTYWSKIPVVHLWCNRSPWEMIYSAWKIKEQIEEESKKGPLSRPVSQKCLEGANHFPHWDEPERLVKILVEN